MQLAGGTNDWWSAARQPSVVRRALKAMLIVGALLITINHGPALARGEMTIERWFTIGLTLMVPYGVSTISSVATIRRGPSLAAPARRWYAAVAAPAVVRRALWCALVVAPLLIAINHGRAVLQGEFNAGRLIQMGLTAVVPYVVSTASSVLAERSQRSSATTVSTRFDDGAGGDPTCP
jgi:hypothetical protein